MKSAINKNKKGKKKYGKIAMLISQSTALLLNIKYISSGAELVI